MSQHLARPSVEFASPEIRTSPEEGTEAEAQGAQAEAGPGAAAEEAEGAGPSEGPAQGGAGRVAEGAEGPADGVLTVEVASPPGAFSYAAYQRTDRPRMDAWFDIIAYRWDASYVRCWA